MSIDVRIGDGLTGRTAVISSRGQVATAPLDFSSIYTNSVTTDNTAVNLVVPKAGKRFVITDLILTGDRSIAVNGAITKVFEATSDSTATVDKLIYEDEIAKQTRAVLNGLNILVTEGRWINAVADDTIVRVNLAGYYVDA